MKEKIVIVRLPGLRVRLVRLLRHSAHVGKSTLLASFVLLLVPADVGAMLDAENVSDIVELDQPCQWSPVARLGGGCTAAYVGSRMLVTAAHCLTGFKTLENEPNDPDEIWFTDTAFQDDDGFFVAIVNAEVCRKHPDAEDPDIGWCRLTEEPPTVARIPVMVPDRCESNWIRQQVLAAAPGRLQITTVGFGWHDEAETERGRKRYTSYGLVGREAATTGRIPVQWTDWDTMIDDPRANGDSGGPNYVRLPDGTWRLLAVHGGVMVDDNLKYSVPSYVSWIEKSSGVDITPCHELDEAPDPGVGNPPNWGRYVYAPSDDCAVAHTTDPMPTAADPNDDVSWADGGCTTPSYGPPNSPPLVDECAHWPAVPSRIRSVLP